MATELTGSVELKRIYEFLNANPANIGNLSLLMDANSLSEAVSVPFSMLESALSVGIYIPQTQPSISGGVITLDCNGRQQSVFNPRESVGVRTITSDFTFAFNNTTGAIIAHCIQVFTGTVIVTMPANVDVIDGSLPDFASWDSGTDQLTMIFTDPNSKVEFSFEFDSDDGRITLIVGGIAE